MTNDGGCYPIRKVCLCSGTIVEHHGAGAQIPERGRLHLGREGLPIRNSVGERTHIVEQKV